MNPTRIILFDDDPIYCKLMERAGQKMNIEVNSCQDLEDFCRGTMTQSYDAALIDYNLGSFKGTAVAKIVYEKPTYLISSDSALSDRQQDWGEHIEGFYSKEIPPVTMLQAITQQLQDERNSK